MKFGAIFDPEAFKQVFKVFPGLKLCLDTGHANIGDPHQKRLVRFVKQFADKIGHVHISDNRGKKDDHFAVGLGTVNFQDFLKQLKLTGYDDTITLEIFSEKVNDLTESRFKIESMLGTC